MSRELIAAVHDLGGAYQEAKRYVFWGECTAEAEPLARLDRESAAKFRAASARLQAALRRRPRRGSDRIIDAADEVCEAAQGMVDALSGWGNIGTELSRIEDAAERVYRLSREVA